MGEIPGKVQNGRGNDHKGGYASRSCAYVCINSAQVERIKGRRPLLKAKSALMIFDRHPEYREKGNRHFWARGYYCETVGNVNEETIKKYIQEQYERDRMEH